ncbi:MAG: hypothetical protein JOZ39_08030 [Chloroflexi bacterium]|nr:hypothetical protein [Chloroflexota bacterium]
MPSGISKSLVRRVDRPAARPLLLRLALAGLASSRQPAPVKAEPSPRALSLEIEVAGLAVEFKAKRLQGVLTAMAAVTALAALLQELARPRQFRTWHGRVAGLVPYDFRRPTMRRLISAIWAPENPRLLSDTAFGVGWTINFAQLPRTLLSGTRAVRRDTRAYDAPRVQTTP